MTLVLLRRFRGGRWRLGRCGRHPHGWRRRRIRRCRHGRRYRCWLRGRYRRSHRWSRPSETARRIRTGQRRTVGDLSGRPVPVDPVQPAAPVNIVRSHVQRTVRSHLGGPVFSRRQRNPRDRTNMPRRRVDADHIGTGTCLGDSAQRPVGRVDVDIAGQGTERAAQRGHVDHVEVVTTSGIDIHCVQITVLDEVPVVSRDSTCGGMVELCTMVPVFVPPGPIGPVNIDTAPTGTAPMDTAPMDTAHIGAARIATAPMGTARLATGLMVPVPIETAPIETVLVETALVETGFIARGNIETMSVSLVAPAIVSIRNRTSIVDRSEVVRLSAGVEPQNVPRCADHSPEGRANTVRPILRGGIPQSPNFERKSAYRRQLPRGQVDAHERRRTQRPRAAHLPHRAPAWRRLRRDGDSGQQDTRCDPARSPGKPAPAHGAGGFTSRADAHRKASG